MEFTKPDNEMKLFRSMNPQGDQDVIIQFEDIRDAVLVITLIRDYDRRNTARLA